METVSLIAVKNVEPGGVEKRDLLFFDQVALPVGWSRPGFHIRPEAAADLAWLQEHELIFDVSINDAFSALPGTDPAHFTRQLTSLLIDLARPISRAAASGELSDIPKSVIQLAHVGAEQLTNNSLRVLASYIQTTRGIRTTPLLMALNWSDLRVLPDLHKIRSLIEATHPVFTRALEHTGNQNLRDLPERIMTLLMSAEAKHFWQDNSSPRLDQPVLELVLEGLPMPDDSTPWEKILEYRADPNSRIHLLALRRWMREIATKQMPPHEVRELFDDNVTAFEDHMRRHRIRTQPGMLRTLITTVADVAEHVGKKEWGKAVRSVSVSHRKLELLEAERTAPGREIAYLVLTQNAFR